MYVTAKRYLSEYGDNGDQEKITAIQKHFPEMAGLGRVNQVEFESMYWRKANAIHRWFVDNVQDGVDECQESYLTSEHLYALQSVCEAVLKDPSQAETLLPAQSGFFFGGTEYDEGYMDDVRRTLGWLNKLLVKGALDDKLKLWWFYYRASW